MGLVVELRRSIVVLRVWMLMLDVTWSQVDKLVMLILVQFKRNGVYR
jgi:hypothetical protein